SSVCSRVRRVLLNGPLKRLVQPQSAYEWAVSRHLSHSITDDLNNPSETQQLAERNVDLLLVCVCKNILRTETIQTPQLGTLNIHPSLLPNYRGPMPVFWMLYDGETTAGVSFQKMIAKIDAGPVVAQYAMSIAAGSTEAELSGQLFQLAADRLGEVLGQVADLQVLGPAVDKSAQGSYHSFPTAQQQAELRARRSAVTNH
ncbi:MAG: formyltransferase family protein, partial [Pirellulaceae bacterium]|nr:formyltransferase family protein [Pirellulaceae bacterium]